MKEDREIEVFMSVDGIQFFAVADDGKAMYRTSRLMPTRREAWQGLVRSLVRELRETRESSQKAVIELQKQRDEFVALLAESRQSTKDEDPDRTQQLEEAFNNVKEQRDVLEGKLAQIRRLLHNAL